MILRGLLYIYMDFKISLLISIKNSARIWLGLHESINQFGETWHLNKLSFLTLEYSITPCIFRSWFFFQQHLIVFSAQILNVFCYIYLKYSMLLYDFSFKYLFAIYGSILDYFILILCPANFLRSLYIFLSFLYVRSDILYRHFIYK